jgi:TonB family protein
MSLVTRHCPRKTLRVTRSSWREELTFPNSSHVRLMDESAVADHSSHVTACLCLFLSSRHGDPRGALTSLDRHWQNEKVRALLLVSVAVLTLSMSDLAFGKEVSSEKSYALFGDVVTIDPHSLTIRSGGKRLVFRITEETKITGLDGRPVQFDQIKPGDAVTVMMKLGPGNVGIAVIIRVDVGASSSNYLNLFRARLISGEVVSGMAINNYVVSKPADDAWSGAGTFEHEYHDGVFLLEVQRDGTVGMVKMVKSMREHELDLRAIRWLKKWRFKPNTVSEVQMPMTYRTWRR